MDDRLLDLDRVLADDYLDGLEGMPLGHLRARKAECGEIEVALSFLRRLVQGRLDIVTAELRQRAGGGGSDLSGLVGQLPEILGGSARAGGGGRLPTALAPKVNLRLLTADLDRIMDVDKAGALPAMEDTEVEAIAHALAELERTVSDRRHAIHERLDAVQSELVRRYRSGEATVDALLK
jgi:tetrahydromethanopterin S-methyltransferase subunit G